MERAQELTYLDVQDLDNDYANDEPNIESIRE